MNQEALEELISDELTRFERHLQRGLTDTEADAMVDSILVQVAKGEVMNAGNAFYDLHPDGDPYDLNTHQGRSKWISDRTQEEARAEREAKAEEPAPELPTEATDAERRQWMTHRLHGDDDAVERLIDVIHERTAEPEPSQ